MDMEEPTDRIEPVHRSGTPSVHEHDIGFEWNDEHENLLQKWRGRTSYYGKLHEMAGEMYEVWNSRISLPTKILFSVISLTEFSQLSNDGNDGNGWNFYFCAFVALIGLIFSIARDYLGWQQRALKHCNSSVAYDKLTMDIEMELCHAREKRTNVRAFMRNMKTRMQDLKETAPDVPPQIVDRYVTLLESMPKKIPPVVTVKIATEIPATATDEKNRESDHTTDIQDEFDDVMNKRIAAAKEKIEEYQIQRLNETRSL